MHSNLILAVSALLLTSSSAFAQSIEVDGGVSVDASIGSPDASVDAAVSASVQIDLFTCSNPLDLLFHSGSQCGCAQWPSSEHTKCTGPSNSAVGDASCCDQGCVIKCHAGMQLNEQKDNCVCKPDYEPSDCKTYCIPKCTGAKEEHNNENTCVCKPGYKKNLSGNCVTGASQVPINPASGGEVYKGKHNKPKSTPVWSRQLHTRDSHDFCPGNLSACPVSRVEGTGSWECVDIQAELQSCGGCVANGEGQDCTLIPGASGVGCQNGACVVLSCAESYRLNASGECVISLIAQRPGRKNKSRKLAI